MPHSNESDESQMSFVLISVRRIYVEVYLWYLEEKSSTYLNGWGNLV